MISVLIVEDHPDLLDDLQFALSHEGFDVRAAASAEQCLELLKDGMPELMILDVMLPGEDGLTLASRLRTHGGPGIIMLTSQGAIEQRIAGLEQADAYLVKPVDIRELAAIMRSLHRRLHPGKAGPGWRLDRQKRLLRAPQGREIQLTQSELQILGTLANSPQQEAPIQRLVEALGENWLHYEKNRMELIISRLRRKISSIAPLPGPCIRAIRNGGYALTLPLES